MKPRTVQYILLIIGWLAATLLLGIKCVLYEIQEYEADLFSILQLSRDYWFGKPFLFENAYGDNSAIHNYYLLPFLAPFTITLGGKGLFAAAWLLWLWAWFLWAKILKHHPLSAGLGFFLIVFGPTAFYQWDNPHFGWHPENYYYPLLMLFSAALLLKNNLVSLLAGLMILLNREDGVILASGLWMIYRWNDDSSFSENVQRSLKTAFAAGLVFMSGMVLLQLRSGGKSRLGEAAERFRQNYTPQLLMNYLADEFWLWSLLAGFLLIPIFFMLKRKNRLIPVGIFLFAVMAVNFVAASYYFPDTKYGMNWAPRLAGTYGILCGILLIAFYQNQQKSRGNIGMLFWGMAVFFIQLQALPGAETDPYSFKKRLQKVAFRENEKLPDETELKQLKDWLAAIEHNEPVQTEEVLFSLADHADYVWPDTLRKPFREPNTAILHRSRNVNAKKWSAADSTEKFIRYVRKKKFED